MYSVKTTDFLNQEQKWTPRAFEFFKVRELETKGEWSLEVPFFPNGKKLYFYERQKKWRWLKHPDSSSSSGYLWGEVLEDQVFLTEGEWDTFALFEAGIKNCATGTTGASSTPESLIEKLSGKTVFVLYDDDEAGEAGAQIVSEKLIKRDCKVSVLNWTKVSGHTRGEDMRDLVTRFEYNTDRILNEIRGAMEPFCSSNETSFSPNLDSAALYGPLRDFIKDVEPETEADVASILVQSLVAIGNYIGPQFYRYAGDQQRGKLFVVIVGNSAKARKGTSWNLVSSLMREVDLTYSQKRIISGLGSGEAIIGKLRPNQEQLANDDPRLLISGGEFSQILSVMKREGSTLSAVVRNAWDNHPLENHTKVESISIPNHHISIISHITRDELTRQMNGQELYNGFANRFLFFWSQRSKSLPFPKEVSPDVFAKHGYLIRDRVNRLKSDKAEGFGLSPSATSKWSEVYNFLSRDRYGLLGAVLSRAEAQVLRMALVYAVLDESRWIDLPHLEAALALWDYAEQSAEVIFNKESDKGSNEAKIRRLLSLSNRVSRTDVSGYLNNNCTSNEIDRVRDFLLKEGTILVSQEKNNKGRPREIWALTKNTK